MYEEYKKVTYKHLHKGQEVYGIEAGTKTGRFFGYVVDINVAFVSIAHFSIDGPIYKYNSTETLFRIKLDNEEYRKKYNDYVVKIIDGIQNKLSEYEIGQHSVDNSWISTDPWELAATCKEANLHIMGYCPDIPPKNVGAIIWDVGLCIAKEGITENKIWCHFSMNGIKTIIERYKYRQEWIQKKDIDLDELEYMLGAMPYIIEENNDEI